VFGLRDTALPDQCVQVGPVSTRFWQMGAEGPDVVLVHGLGGSVENWAANIGPLAQEHRVWALDLIGAGWSDRPAVSYSIDNLARFLTDFLETQGIERGTLVGHSLGGAVVLHVAISCSERVDKLVLVSSGGLGREIAPILRLCTLPLAGEMVFRPTRARTARLFRALVYDPAIVSGQMIDGTWAMRALPGARRALLSTLRDNVTVRGTRPEVVRFIRDNLRSITAPTQVIWGRDDPIVPLTHASLARQGIPDARLTVFDACGHIPQLECAAQFNAVVCEFLGHDTNP
jgi:pimeloyl-ACP methyl ester carboxylesterase